MAAQQIPRSLDLALNVVPSSPRGLTLVPLPAVISGMDTFEPDLTEAAPMSGIPVGRVHG